MTQVPSQVPSTVLLALSEILAAQSPQFAARLKQRLTAALNAKGEPPFDEKKFGFKGFRDFLLRGTQDIFSVTQRDGGDDIVVSLLGANSASSTSSQPSLGTSHSLRSEIWQAFTNPDVKRVRYLSRRTYAVRHFLRGEDNTHAKEVLDSPADFVEITPINADVQVTWMKEFIEKHQIKSPLRDALEGIAAHPYSSGVNAAFTGALGSLEDDWRQERVKNIIDTIHRWANANDVSTDKLTRRSGFDSEAIPVPASKSIGKQSRAVDVTNGVQNSRDQAVRLLDMLSNEDISRIVIPILLSTMLVRGKS